MSQYEYYEFRTVNRQLTAQERKRVNALSSHGHTTATSFSVTYNYGSFKHSEDSVLSIYFDAFFFISNWGSATLKFRYPRGLVDTRNWEPYYTDDYEGMMIECKEVGDSVILSFRMNSESGFDWVEGEGQLDGLVDLYQDILAGDYRVFYLGWLRAIDNSLGYGMSFDEDCMEPPIPPELGQLSPALKSFVETFDINKDFIAAAATESAAQSSTVQADEKAALALLTPEESVDFLHRFLQGEDHLQVKLKQRIGLLQPAVVNNPAGTRTVGMLMEAVGKIEEQHKIAVAAVKETKRKAQMQALADRGEQAWQEVENFIGKKNNAGYKQAAILLQQLEELANSRGETALFGRRLEQIRGRNSRRPALMRELDLRQL